MTDSKQGNQPTTKPKGVVILFLALMVWGAVIAVGTFQTQASTDIRRPLIVLAVLGTFIGVWGAALLNKNRAESRK